MAQSLYRKYRPQTFDDVVGQQHITRTLRNALAEDAVAHAYLFTGPRGTGKTTTARILAKALECEKGPTPDPDTTCEQCIAVAEGTHPDVYELDAASRTQVDNVREEIIGRLAYAPTRGRYKVYIIDEVHMLSTHSFNALLKSIEEPPAHTVFVLCTTHPHKVPETIHSRCQRFDFHRIGIDDIVARLAYIAEHEDISVAEGSLTLIAKHAAGGMRDAITTLEQLAAFTGKDISLDDVEKLLGEVDVALLYELADLIADRDIAGCFRFVARLSGTGVDMTEFVRDLIGHFRDLYVVAAVGDASGIVDTTEEQLARLTTQAPRFGTDRLARVLDLLGELSSEMRWSSDHRLSLEVALTRMARPQGELTLSALSERVEALELGTPTTQARPAPAVSAPTPATSSVAEKPAPEPAPTTQEPRRDPEPEPPATSAEQSDQAPVVVEAIGEVTLDRAHAKRAWPAVLAEVKRERSSRAYIFANTEIDVEPDGATLVIEFPADQKFTLDLARNPETRELLQRALARVFGGRVAFRYQLGRGAVRPVEVDEAPAPVDVSPSTGGDETDSSPAPSPADDDIERMMSELGAEKVAEYPHETDDGKEDL